MLNEVADGVWVRQSDWVWTNTTVVRTDDGLVVVDPGISASELAEIADDIERLGIPVVAGFSTHPHWDHLLWHRRFGDVPRYATAEGAEFAAETIELQRQGATEDAEDVPLDLIALVTPLPSEGGPLRGELVEHRAHAPGHAAVLLADRGVLIAGDMLSDILIPIFDPRQEGQLGAFESALDQLEALVSEASVVIPGHGSVGEGADLAARLAADRAYVAALRQAEEPADERLETYEWEAGIHQSNLKQVGGK